MTFHELPKKKVKDLFNLEKPLVTVSKDMLARDLTFLFIEKGISGVPVVDQNSSLQGIVSMSDLAKSEAILDLKGILELIFLEAPPEIMGTVNKHLSENYYQLKVGDIMTNDPICVSQEDSICDVIRLMLENKIHRVIITRDNKPLGIITNSDILSIVSEYMPCN